VYESRHGGKPELEDQAKNDKLYIHIYIYIYMVTFSGSTSEPQRQNGVEQTTNAQIYTIFYSTKYYKHLVNVRNKNPTRCHLLYYCTFYRLNMFQTLLCPSSKARDYDVDYHIGRFVLGLLYVGG